MTQRRLSEKAFPLKKVSEDSKHEKNVRHGHVSTLHIWPALDGIKMVLPPSVHRRELDPPQPCSPSRKQGSSRSEQKLFEFQDQFTASEPTRISAT